jgi:class 3 adenylate cyclase
VYHIGYVISGRLQVEMRDGASVELTTGDVFEVPPGHDAWVVGDKPWISVDYAGRRLFAKPTQEFADRVLRTVVFTDLCRSTETLERLGDASWRLLLAEHNQRARVAMERFSGREIDSAGDGFLILFDSPAAAVRGAAAMVDAAASLDLMARGAVHTGEVELHGENVRGIAVHLAARVLGLAQPGEVLVTSTVQELLAGAGLDFEPRGEHELRGITGRRSIAALIW